MPEAKRDTAEILARLRTAAERGEPEAAYQLGRALVRGWGVTEDRGAALNWLLEAATAGHVRAASMVAGLYPNESVDRGRAATLVRILSTAAKRGDAEAQVALGWCYQQGVLVGQDMARAVSWYTQAAASEHADGHYNLALCLQRGRGTAFDPERATRHLEIAARLDHPRAQLMLGRAYCTGLGVRRDVDQAIHWYRRAAGNGYAKAQYNLAVLLAGGDGNEPDDVEAAYWMRAAARQGYNKAQFGLSNFYRRGIGVDEDEAAAMHWLRRAACGGYGKAAYGLYRRLRKSAGSGEDPEYWLRQAACADHIEAQLELGRRLVAGGNRESTAEAVTWFERASATGSPRARYNLAVCYLRGRGVPRDTVHAYRLLEQAAGAGYARAANALSKLEEKLDAATLARARENPHADDRL